VSGHTENEDATEPNRRDLLKMSGVAAVGAAGFWAAANAALGADAGATTVTTHVPTTVTLSYDGVLVGGLVRMSQTSEITPATSGGASVSATRIHITREWGSNYTFIDWYQDAVAGKMSSTAVVTVYGKRNSKVSQLTMMDATPTDWSGPQYDKTTPSAVATESITLTSTNWTFS
jgi:hypothetical protein